MKKILKIGKLYLSLQCQTMREDMNTNTPDTMDTNTNICLFFATEENGYEEDFLGTFNTTEEAFAYAKESLVETDFVSEQEAEAMRTEYGFEGESGQGYHIIYIVGERDYCLSVLYGMREDFLEMFEDEDE